MWNKRVIFLFSLNYFDVSVSPGDRAGAVATKKREDSCEPAKSTPARRHRKPDDGKIMADPVLAQAVHGIPIASPIPIPMTMSSMAAPIAVPMATPTAR